MKDIDKEINRFMVEMVKKQPNIPKGLDLFLVTEESYVRFHDGFLDMGKNYNDIVLLNIKKLNLDRGGILGVFSKMEFLFNELIYLLVIEYDAKKRDRFNDVLDNLSFHRRIELLRTWGFINNNECERLIKLKNVRNGFAHAWSKKEVFYKGQPIEKNFDVFKGDLKNIWLLLLEIYKRRQTKINLDEIRKKLGLI